MVRGTNFGSKNPAKSSPHAPKTVRFTAASCEAAAEFSESIKHIAHRYLVMEGSILVAECSESMEGSSSAAECSESEAQDKKATLSEDNLLDAVYNYLNEGRYPVEASADKKRSVRRKAKKFAVKNGELFYLKKVKKVN